MEELSDDENVEFANENNISTENEIDSKEEFPAGGIFRTYVTRELQTLRTAINNLCGQGNLVFGAVNTLELLKEIDTLREEVRKKDIIINNLREGKRGNYLDPPEPREQPPIWKIPPEIARRRGQPQNTWDPTIEIHDNRSTSSRDDAISATPQPGDPKTPSVVPPRNATPISPPHAQLPQNSPRFHQSRPNQMPFQQPQPPQQHFKQHQPPPIPFQPPPRFPPLPTSSAPPRPEARRPLVVTNPYPERQTGMRVVPGDKPYNKAHEKKILIVTDSICRGIQ